jgi:hypothetical protein
VTRRQRVLPVVVEGIITPRGHGQHHRQQRQPCKDPRRPLVPCAPGTRSHPTALLQNRNRGCNGETRPTHDDDRRRNQDRNVSETPAIYLASCNGLSGD